MKITHKKIQNTGILFELLVRTITSETISGKDSVATNILKKYFSKTELGREYKLYEYLFKHKKITESKAEIIINTLIDNYSQLNRSSLRKQKYNLIKEIKENYDLDSFFKTKIPHYKEYASLYMLFELYSNKTSTPDQIIKNKLVLLEFLSNPPIIINNQQDKLINEFKTYDKDTRLLTYKLLLDKFNNKYSNLNENQKLILKEYIISSDNTPRLKNFYNDKVISLKKSLKEVNKSTRDIPVKIKIETVSSMLNEINKQENVKTKNILNLLTYYSLLEELKCINTNSKK